ncbi:MAG: hypothetical protein GXO74_06890 [Calditrichaeota bacterium]|nr:hypothetical protein [Calditrichota bacterium]
MDSLFFIVAVIFIYAVDVFFFVWISCRFVAADKISQSQIIIVAVSVLIFTFLFFSALLQAPLAVKPLILGIAFVVIIGIFVYSLQTHPAKATLAGVFFIFFQFLLTVFLLRHFWDNRFIQALKYIFLESLY